jgi:putative sugar O-methyltransferase
MTTRPQPLPPDPQAEPSSPRERAIAYTLGARATLDPFASASLRRGLRLGRYFGTTWCLKILMHPQWLTELRAPIPRREVTFTEPAAVTEEQLALCERIARAYRAARGDPNDLPPIWSDKVTRYYGTLERALTAGDPRALNEQLRWLFRRPFLAGISTPIDYETPGAQRYWALLAYDRLASLAEAVGVLRTESPEQGPVGRIFKEDLDALPARIEAALETSLDHPRVGAPYGILIGGRLITRETGVYLLAATWLREAIAVHLQRPAAEEVHIVEIGGGYGGAAMWYLRLPQRHQGSYTIVDLPLMNAFQAYFLGQVYGERALALCGEETDGAPIRILPPQVLTGPRPIAADVVYNQDCLPELSERTAREYLAWMQAHLNGVFLSCNQEGAAPVGGVAQLVVSELAAEYPGLTRIARRRSWLRRGYVEEVYRCGAG